jgi:hypothetical protein
MAVFPAVLVERYGSVRLIGYPEDGLLAVPAPVDPPDLE